MEEACVFSLWEGKINDSAGEEINGSLIFLSDVAFANKQAESRCSEKQNGGSVALALP